MLHCHALYFAFAAKVLRCPVSPLDNVLKFLRSQVAAGLVCYLRGWGGMLVLSLVLSLAETLDEANKRYCNRCKDHVMASKTLQVWSLPEILVVHLKRFE